MKVTVVSATPATILVEWYDGALHRVLLPAQTLHDDAVNAADLAAGVPYGIAWEDILPMKATPQALANELRRCGIWTMADLLAQPTVAVAALQRVYATDLAALRRAAQGYERGGETR